jgi:CBS domain-containing protein
MSALEGGPAKIAGVHHCDGVKEAAARMFSYNVGCLVVKDDQGRFIGLVTERDIARTAIPLGARIVAVPSTFDALTSTRSYHASRTVVEALHLLKDTCGYDFDLTVVVALAAWVEEVAQRLNTTPDRLIGNDLLATAETQDAMPLPDVADTMIGAPGPNGVGVTRPGEGKSRIRSTVPAS